MTHAVPGLVALPDGNAKILRAAGLRVTSTRLAALRLAPAVMAEHGYVNHQLLHQAARKAGYAFSLNAFYNVLPRLASAGLLPSERLIPIRGKASAVPSPTTSTGQ